MANPIRAAAARGVRGLLVVLAAGFHTPLSSPHHRLLVGATTTSAASGGCAGDAANDACNADAECSACFSGWGAAVASSTAVACEDRFPNVASPCQLDGARFCCNLGDEETADACMANSLFVAFLGCFMEGFQCSIDDMPCFDNGVFTPAPSPATGSPTTALAASEHPTAFPTAASLDTDRGFEMTASPSSPAAEAGVVALLLPAALAEACDEETAACVADEACVEGCVTGILETAAATTSGYQESYSTCQLGYLVGNEMSSSSLGSSISISDVCDVVSSAFCCSGSGSGAESDTKGDCATNEAAQELWSCAFDFYGCSMEDAACIEDAGASGAPRRSVPPGGYVNHLKTLGVILFSCCVAFVLGLFTVEF